MTRETKIGLFVGMGVIILIGILISDHLSHAQKQQAPDYSKFFPDAREKVSSSGKPAVTTVASADRPLSVPGEVGKPAPLAPVTGVTTAAKPEADKPSIFVQDNRNLPPARATLPVDQSESKAGTTPIRLSPDRPGLISDPAPSAPGKTVHVVKEGDTLSSLSRQYYGKAAYWSLIHEANKSVIENPNNLKDGTKLEIPARAATPTTVAGTVTPKVPTKEIPVSTPIAKPVASEYTIQKGDTLGVISEKFLGTKNRWEEIYELNKDRIKNPNAMKEGTVIRLPQRGNTQ